jgi:hypothetical protein
MLEWLSRPMINKNLSCVSLIKKWTDAELMIKPALLKGITEELGWIKPSRIQSIALKYIIYRAEDNGKFDNMIIDNGIGIGKTGLFAVGSLLRVNPQLKKN